MKKGVTIKIDCQFCFQINLTISRLLQIIFIFLVIKQLEKRRTTDKQI